MLRSREGRKDPMLAALRRRRRRVGDSSATTSPRPAGIVSTRGRGFRGSRRRRGHRSGSSASRRSRSSSRSSRASTRTPSGAWNGRTASARTTSSGIRRTTSTVAARRRAVSWRTALRAATGTRGRRPRAYTPGEKRARPQVRVDGRRVHDAARRVGPLPRDARADDSRSGRARGRVGRRAGARPDYCGGEFSQGPKPSISLRAASGFGPRRVDAGATFAARGCATGRFGRRRANSATRTAFRTASSPRQIKQSGSSVGATCNCSTSRRS